MNTKAESETTSAFDLLKWGVSIALVVAGIYGYYHFDQYPQLYRVVALCVDIGIALVLAVYTQGGGAFWALMRQSLNEWYKIVWPTREETTQTTMIVVLVVFVMAIILWLLDMFFGWLAGLIIG